MITRNRVFRLDLAWKSIKSTFKVRFNTHFTWHSCGIEELIFKRHEKGCFCNKMLTPLKDMGISKFFSQFPLGLSDFSHKGNEDMDSKKNTILERRPWEIPIYLTIFRIPIFMRPKLKPLNSQVSCLLFLELSTRKNLNQKSTTFISLRLFELAFLFWLSILILSTKSLKRE